MNNQATKQGPAKTMLREGQSNARYNNSSWEEYADLFTRFTTPAQNEVYEVASKVLSGHVLDAGSGSGKMALYLRNKPNVYAYTGVDCSNAMVSAGNSILRILNKQSFVIKQCMIEEVVGSFDSAVSIQSFYSWPNPEVTLQHIHKVLKPKAKFVLASANNKLDLIPLIIDAEKMLIGHPEFEAYKQHNIRLADNTDGNFLKLDELLKVVQMVGFSVLEANQNYFQGGLNFLVLKKQEVWGKPD